MRFIIGLALLVGGAIYFQARAGAPLWNGLTRDQLRANPALLQGAPAEILFACGVDCNANECWVVQGL